MAAEVALEDALGLEQRDVGRVGDEVVHEEGVAGAVVGELRRGLLQRDEVLQLRRRELLDVHHGDHQRVAVLQPHVQEPAVGLPRRPLELDPHPLQVRRARDVRQLHRRRLVLLLPLAVVGATGAQQVGERHERHDGELPERAPRRGAQPGVRVRPPQPRLRQRQAVEVEQVVDVVARRQRLELLVVLAEEAVHADAAEEVAAAGAARLQLRVAVQRREREHLGDDEERDLVFEADEVGVQLRRRPVGAVEQRVLVPRGEVEHVLEEEGGVEHQQVDERLGGEVFVHGLLVEPARPVLHRRHAGLVADQRGEDGDLVDGVRGAARDEGVEVRHLEVVAVAAERGVGVVDGADGDELWGVRLGAAVQVADVRRDAADAGPLPGALVRRRLALVVFHEVAGEALLEVGGGGECFCFGGLGAMARQVGMLHGWSQIRRAWSSLIYSYSYCPTCMGGYKGKECVGKEWSTMVLGSLRDLQAYWIWSTMVVLSNETLYMKLVCE